MNKYVITGLLIFLSYFYLYPGPNLALQGSTTLVMSDGGDPAGAPFQYDSVLNVFKDHPSYWLYGSIYSEDLNPEVGVAFWMSWSERIAVLLSSLFLPLEQLSFGVVFFLTILSGLAMHALCRFLKWNKWVAAGLAIAWAFSAYMRARAKVHMSMTGIFHLPLIFLGLFLIVRGKTKRSLALAALCFLLSAFTVHYYIITCAFLSPFFLLFLYLQPEFKFKVHAQRLLISIVPAVLFLAINLMFPIPSGVKMNASNSIPQTGNTGDGSIHPFLYVYSAQPIDFLTNDLGLDYTPTDLNPLRYYLNEYVQNNLRQGNPHERTHGVRWSILAIAFFGSGLALYSVFNKTRPPLLSSDRRVILYFAGLGLFAAWLSFSPDFPMVGWGPSGWLHSLVNQIRVPNRAAIVTNFSFLMIVGFLLNSTYAFRLKKYLLLPFAFPALMILDYPPMVQQMPVSKILPVSQNLKAEDQICGTGIHLPYFSIWTDIAYYHFLQRIRGTRCTTVNGTTSEYELKWLTEKFPPRNDLIVAWMNSPYTIDTLKKMADCVPLSWITFEPGLTTEWAKNVCDKLGWVFYPDFSCVTPGPRKEFKKWPSKCGI